MAAEKIGDGRCPLCAGSARVSLSKSGLAVMTCNGCNMQLFTRSGRSDEMVRGLLRPAEASAPLPAPIPLPVSIAPAVAPAVPAPAPVAAKPAAKPGRIGIFASW